jgi:hypothetical protein
MNFATRILDNDMGAVLKTPLTGRGTVHGITMTHDFVISEEKNSVTKKMEVITERVTVPEFDVGLLEMLSTDRGVTRVTAHCISTVSDSDRANHFIECYKQWVEPIYLSGKSKY